MGRKEFQEKLEANLSGKVVYLGKHKTYGLLTKCIPTGAPSLDRIIAKDVAGQFGFPCGKVSFIAGKPGSGKSTLCLHLCAETQKAGGLACYIDGEYRLDRLYAQQIGVNVDDLFYSQPLSFEDMLETTQSVINMVLKIKEDKNVKYNIDDVPVVIICDSTSIATKSELDAEEYCKGDKGVHARICSQAMRTMIPSIGKTNVCVVFVCQIKSKINIGGRGQGPKETFLAEDSLRYHSSVGLRAVRISTVKDKNDITIGDTDLFKTTKNSCMAPLQEAKVELVYGFGFNYYISLTDTILEYYGGEVNGSWYGHPDLGKWQGKHGIQKMFEKDKDFEKKVGKLLASQSGKVTKL